MADSLDSGSSVHYGRAGSTPASRTKQNPATNRLRGFCAQCERLSACNCLWRTGSRYGILSSNVFRQYRHPSTVVAAACDKAEALSWRRKTENRQAKVDLPVMAEMKRFELLRRFPDLPHFKCGPFDRLGTSPNIIFTSAYFQRDWMIASCYESHLGKGCTEKRGIRFAASF